MHQTKGLGEERHRATGKSRIGNEVRVAPEPLTLAFPPFLKGGLRCKVWRPAVSSICNMEALLRALAAEVSKARGDVDRVSGRAQVRQVCGRRKTAYRTLNPVSTFMLPCTLLL